jgi:hypothetical protein
VKMTREQRRKIAVPLRSNSVFTKEHGATSKRHVIVGMLGGSNKIRMLAWPVSRCIAEGDATAVRVASDDGNADAVAPIPRRKVRVVR